ncbi:hypothetical protein C8J57DRAFT_1712078 [Mycena rebaudengoi]|nr:hypothetical protein C8J57DRAFT_1712078 [Mycena rebaudengoi]
MSWKPIEVPVPARSSPMPPKGSAKIREEDFFYNEDRTKIQCKICAAGVPVERRAWIAASSAVKHLAGKEHAKAVVLAADVSRAEAALARERNADSATQDLRTPAIVAQIRSAPIASGAATAVRNEAEKEMWADYEMHGAEFDAGADELAPQARFKELGKEADMLGFWNPVAVARELGFGDEQLEGEIGVEDEDEAVLAEILRNAGLHEPEPEEIPEIQGESSKPPPSSDWFPYPSRIMFLLDTLDNLPHLRISNSSMRVFLWILKEAQCKDVPSFNKLRQVQKEIRSESGIPSIPCKSVQGNVFFMNDPKAIIARDWSNPTTRKFIHVYPEIPEDGVIREIWHAQKWRKNMDLDILSPMFDAGTSHYYVNELALLKNGDFVIPIRWATMGGKVYADAYSVIVDDKRKATVRDEEIILICADDLEKNYFDLDHAGLVPEWADVSIDSGHPGRIPNPKRNIAGGHPLYCSFVDYFGDDVSGNRTKSWNKHWNSYMTHRNLPRHLLQQEFHVHFVSTSPNASISEQYKEFEGAVAETHTNPVRLEDETGKTTCFCIHVNAGPSDNPMQSEISAHIGGKGNHFCRKCQVGGTQKEKETNDGYHALFEAGVPRTKEIIIEELEKQVRLACTGVAKSVKDSQTETGIKDVYTQYWIDDLIARYKDFKKQEPDRSDQSIQRELVGWTLGNRDKIYSAFLTTKGFDPTKDTPVEILHTILLGIIKYIWHSSHMTWTPAQKQTYSRRLQSTETDGLSIHAIRANYIMQYAGSLIGRQLKTLAQTNVFHVRGLVTDAQFAAWKSAGELSALLWFTEIRNLEEYRRDLKVAVANVLDTFAVIDPSKIVSKIKYHLLPHIEEDVVEFGPLLGMITEIYECFNRFLAKHLILQRLLGWSEEKVLVHGEVKLEAAGRGQKERTCYKLRETTAAQAVNIGDYQPESMWNKCKHVTSESLDQCFIGSWVFIQSTVETGFTRAGRISDILHAVSGSSVIVVIEQFQVLSSRDPVYGMPVLVRRDGETSYIIVPAKTSAMCNTTATLLDKTENYIIHNNLDRFIINSHAFHNAHLLRATLPDLLTPIPVFADRRAKHDELAAELRAKRETKVANRKSKKRQRPEDDDQEEGREPKRKRAKTGRQSAPSHKNPRRQGELMVASRGRRTIKRTKKAMEMDEDKDELTGSSGAEDYDSEWSGNSSE